VLSTHPRICLDLSPAVHGRAGIGRYAQELAAALVAGGGGLEYTLFYNAARTATVEPPLAGVPRLEMALADRPWRLRVLLAHLVGRAQDGLFPGVDLFHATDHLLPRFSAVPSVFTLHDLTCRLYPAAHMPLNRWFHLLSMPRFLRQAEAVIAVSESTRRDAVRLFGIDEGKVHVVYEGVSPRFRPASHAEVAAVRQKYGLPEAMILFVGTIEPRKNLGTLVDAWAALRAQGAPQRLVIAGRRGWRCGAFFARLRELGVEEEVTLPGFVEEADLPALYSAAELFAFPSLYEGFGLPVLEAMACGTPVVCSDRSSLPEVAGEAALLAGPTDVAAWVGAMGRALADPALRAKLRAAGLARARRFTWQAAAEGTRQVYGAVTR